MNVNTIQSPPAIKGKWSARKNLTAPFSKVLARQADTVQAPPGNQDMSSSIPLSPTYKSSADGGVFGAYYDDAHFAEDIRRHEGVTISTAQKINWGATGEHQLTPEELALLKGKYDVTDLTLQDLYNLIADMTNLNAMSAEQAVFKYRGVKSIPDPELFKSVKCIGMGGDFLNHMDWGIKPERNVIKLLREGLKFSIGGLEHVKSEEFKLSNQSAFKLEPDLFPKYEEMYKENKEFMEGMLSIFGQLVREGSEWALDQTAWTEEPDAEEADGKLADEVKASLLRSQSAIPPKNVLQGLLGTNTMLSQYADKQFMDLLRTENEQIPGGIHRAGVLY